jgi:L-rhamnose mutarotase
MQRICFVLQVKPEKRQEYKERHRSVWPEMVNAVREAGWNNYSLFLRPDGLLVGYLETETSKTPALVWPSGKSMHGGNATWQTLLFRWTALCPTEPWHRSKKSFISDAALRTM